MTNVQTGMPLNIKTLNTMKVGKDDSVVNGVNIPILYTIEYAKEYYSIYKEIEKIGGGNAKGNINLDLHIIAKAGHNIYDYDGNYDYYYAAYIVNREGKYCLARIQINLDEQEQVTVQNAIWRNRNKLKCARAQVINIIRTNYGSDVEFFCDGIYNRQYRSSWQNANRDGLITAYVENIDTGDCAIEITTYGNV